MEESVEGEDVTQESYEDGRRWRPVIRRKAKKSTPERQHVPPPSTGEGMKHIEQRIHQIIKASKMPYLPKEDSRSTVKADNLPEEAQEQDTICINYQQNITVTITPIEEHTDKYKKIVCISTNTQECEAGAYESAPDNASKGVIRGMGREASAQDIQIQVEVQSQGTPESWRRHGNTNGELGKRGHGEERGGGGCS
ncbi:hypothetical protein HPB49_007301 [Dermacentor silvarum]|uniref:Uncharacterized protein n=1 Tax=Dermacentor silvarum TaxID=543639 RepID=A0ACB8CQL0_DERSI|nr:hypothetical protein HPB49_007301 [Dermacentor silvarum]